MLIFFAMAYHLSVCLHSIALCGATRRRDQWVPNFFVHSYMYMCFLMRMHSLLMVSRHWRTLHYRQCLEAWGVADPQYTSFCDPVWTSTLFNLYLTPSCSVQDLQMHTSLWKNISFTCCLHPIWVKISTVEPLLADTPELQTPAL